MFYRLTPVEALGLPGPEYLALAARTFAYQGVMAARAAKEEDEGGPRQSERSDVRMIDGSRESLQAEMGPLFSFGSADA